MQTANITAENLAQYYGTQQWYRHMLNRKLLYTDGVHFLEENGAAWLLDAIASYITPRLLKNPRLRDFQLWELKVNLAKHSAVLTCREDADVPPAVTQRIEYTDFPLESIKFYVEPISETQWCLMLTSER